MRFAAEDALPDLDPAATSWLQFGKSDVIWLATLGAMSVVSLFALGFVLRPMALKLVAGLPGPLPQLAITTGASLPTPHCPGWPARSCCLGLREPDSFKRLDSRRARQAQSSCPTMQGHC